MFFFFRISARFGFRCVCMALHLNRWKSDRPFWDWKWRKTKAIAHTLCSSHFIWLFGYWTKTIRVFYTKTHTHFNWYPHDRHYMHWLMNLCVRCIRRFGFHFFFSPTEAGKRAGVRNAKSNERNRDREAKGKRTNRVRCENKRQTQVDWF